jgi:hypothetical protein
MSTGTDKRKSVCSFTGMVLGPNDVEFTQLRLHTSRPGKRKGVGRNTSARSLGRVGSQAGLCPASDFAYVCLRIALRRAL